MTAPRTDVTLVRIVEALSGERYRLSCGHVVIRKRRVTRVVCEHCNPVAYAARVAHATMKKA